MLTIMLFFAICAYLRGLSYVIALSTVLAYGYCCLKSGCPLLNNLFGILAMIITIVTILGNRLIILLKHLTTVNREIKNTHQTILSLSNMTKSDMLCLLQLAGKNDLMSLQTDKLMELIELYMISLMNAAANSELAFVPVYHACAVLIAPFEIILYEDGAEVSSNWKSSKYAVPVAFTTQQLKLNTPLTVGVKVTLSLCQLFSIKSVVRSVFTLLPPKRLVIVLSENEKEES